MKKGLTVWMAVSHMQIVGASDVIYKTFNWQRIKEVCNDDAYRLFGNSMRNVRGTVARAIYNKDNHELRFTFLRD